GPKIATPGLPNAAAKCSGPLSTPTTAFARRVASIKPAIPDACTTAPSTPASVSAAASDPFNTRGIFNPAANSASLSAGPCFPAHPANGHASTNGPSGNLPSGSPGGNGNVITLFV